MTSGSGPDAGGTRSGDVPWWSPPRGIQAVIAGYLAGLLLVSWVPSATGALVLRSPLLVDAANPLRLLTYSFVTPGLVSWIYLALFTWASAVVLRHRLAERWMLAAMAGGALVGGVVFGIRTSGVALAGGFIASWGLAGAVIGAFMRRPGQFPGWRRAYPILVGGIVLSAAFGGGGANAAIVGAALAGGLIGALRSTPPAD